MANGRKTGGRVPGSRNKRTAEVEALIESLASEGLSPLEVMLKAMKHAWDEGNKMLACSVAKDAAPYCHPRLNAVELSGEVTTSKVIRAPVVSKSPNDWANTHIPKHLQPTEH